MIDEVSEKEYPSFVVNKCLSYFPDTIHYANVMNKYNYMLDNKIQYEFYLYSIRKRKRFSPWIKKENDENLEAVKEYYESIGWKPEKIKKHIERLKDDTELKEEADDCKTKLVEAIKEEREAMLKEQEAVAEDRRIRVERFNKAVREAIYKDEDAADREKKELDKFVYDYKYQDKQGNKFSEFMVKMNEINSDPKKYAKFLKFVQNIDTYEDKDTTKKKETAKSFSFFKKGSNPLEGAQTTEVIKEKKETFGIEIARTRLLREIHTAYESAGHVVGYTHLSILVDLMTIGGNIISIDRHGINKTEIDVLGRASFESTVEQILTAGLFGEIDNMKGVSSRLIGGLVIKGGTGFCDVILDTNMIEKSEYSGENKYRSYTDIVSDVVTKDIINNDVEENTIFIPM